MRLVTITASLAIVVGACSSFLSSSAPAANADQATYWLWEDDYGSRVELWRTGDGPLAARVSAGVSCPGHNGDSIGADVSVGWPTDPTVPRVSVAPDGSFAYSGPVSDPPAYPESTLQISGHVSGRAVTGAFRIGVDGSVYQVPGAPCRARSQLLSFVAKCMSGCEKAITTARNAAKKPTVTVFPGVGVGGPGLRMRGVAKIGMTKAQVLALFTSKLREAERGQVLIFHPGPPAPFYEARFFFTPELRSGDQRLAGIDLEAGIRTSAGVVDRSTEAQLVTAYPRARCKQGRSLRECSLLRGTASQGVLTKFGLLHDRLAIVGIRDCAYSRYQLLCPEALRP